MDFTKVKLKSLTWSDVVKRKGINYNGHYYQAKGRVRRTKNSFSCYLIRSQSIKYNIQISLKKNNGSIELKIKCLNNGLWIENFNFTVLENSLNDKSEKQFIVLPVLSLLHSKRIFLHFSEQEKRKPTKKELAPLLVSYGNMN